MNAPSFSKRAWPFPLAPPEPANAALYDAVRRAARWFEPERVGMVGYIVYPLEEPGVVLSVIGRCQRHIGADGTAESCDKLVHIKHIYSPAKVPTAAEVRAEMLRQAEALRRWIGAGHPEHLTPPDTSR